MQIFGLKRIYRRDAFFVVDKFVGPDDIRAAVGYRRPIHQQERRIAMPSSPTSYDLRMDKVDLKSST